nr:phytolongin Phyl1.1-like [Ipomoea batatas]
MVIGHSCADGFVGSGRLGKSRVDRVMKDFILDFEYLAEGLVWYLLLKKFPPKTETLLLWNCDSEGIWFWWLGAREIEMDSSKKGVSYCSVSKGGRVLYTYNEGGLEIENLAALCLEKAPPHHRWYFQTMGKRTFCFLMEDGYVYFAIAEEALGNAGVLRFLQNLRHEFKKFARRGSSRSMSSLSSLSSVQEQLVPVIRNLITSLEHVSGGDTDWPAGGSSPNRDDVSASDANGQIEGGSSTRAPLLSKSGKYDKKKKKEHAIAMRDIEMEEHRMSTDRARGVDSGARDCNSYGAAGSPLSLTKEFGSGRSRATNPNFQKKWCRLVRIILAVDAAVCLLLLMIWLVNLSCQEKDEDEDGEAFYFAPNSGREPLHGARVVEIPDAISGTPGLAPVGMDLFNGEEWVHAPPPRSRLRHSKTNCQSN